MEYTEKQLEQIKRTVATEENTWPRIHNDGTGEPDIDQDIQYLCDNLCTKDGHDYIYVSLQNGWDIYVCTCCRKWRRAR